MRSATYSSALAYMTSAVRVMVALRRFAMTIITARWSSEALTSWARLVSDSLISTWWLQRLSSSEEGLVDAASRVMFRPVTCVASARVSSMWTRNFSLTLRLTLAVTFGLPSRSEPIQLPG